MASKKYKPIERNIINKVFNDIAFREVEFSCSLFHNCIFRDCNFEDMYFYDCAFNCCKFINCNLKKTRWRGVSIDNVEFTESALIGSVFNSPHIVSTIFKECSLRDATIKNFDFYMVQFDGCVLSGSVFREGYFMGSRMHPIASRKGTSEGSKFVTKPYKDACFYAVDFIRSWLGYIDFNKFFMWWHCSFHDCAFNSCKNIPYIPMTCPEEGSFIAYKKVLKRFFSYGPKVFDNNENVMIAVLEIPADAKRSSGAGTRKCRCNKAKVLRFEDLDGNVLNDVVEGFSAYNGSFIYHVGEYVTEDNFDENRWEQCSKGIHFFMNRQEAINYNLN